MTPRKIRPLSVADAAWLAGIIDGEGTVALARKHAGDNRQPVVTISSTEPAIVQAVLAMVGAGKITGKRVARAHHTPSLTYAITNRQALALLQAVLPYLRGYKAERARLLVERYLLVTPRNGKYTPELVRARQDFELAFASIRSNGRHSGLATD